MCSTHGAVKAEGSGGDLASPCTYYVRSVGCFDRGVGAISVKNRIVLLLIHVCVCRMWTRDARHHHHRHHHQVVGAPSEESWPGVSKYPCFIPFSAPEGPPPRAPSALFGAGDCEGAAAAVPGFADLVGSLLQANPANRLSVSCDQTIFFVFCCCCFSCPDCRARLGCSTDLS